MENDRSILIRRTVLFGTPLLYLVLGLLHPNPDPGFGDDTGLFIGLHFAQLFLIGGLAYSLWLLVDGVENQAARIARALILPYVITYAAFDAVAGIAMGNFVREANAAPPADQAAAERLIDALREETWSGYLIYALVALLWLAAAVAVVFALRKSAPRAALVLMGLGAAIFAVGHPQPTGPAGMALFLAGVVWLELRPRPEEASTEAISVQPT